jgi:hypothetical protein
MQLGGNISNLNLSLALKRARLFELSRIRSKSIVDENEENHSIKNNLDSDSSNSKIKQKNTTKFKNYIEVPNLQVYI